MGSRLKKKSVLKSACARSKEQTKERTGPFEANSAQKSMHASAQKRGPKRGDQI